MKTSTRIIDYHLKFCMVEQKCKNNITRKKVLGKGLFSIPISPRNQRNEKIDDYQL
jgi:hypothetical protein